jgi:ketosteroid isomerase-like protein
MAHPNEKLLRDAYAAFGQGDIAPFLDACADNVTITVPGNTPGSGKFSKAEFPEWIMGVLEPTGGTFREEILELTANDDGAILLLDHQFDRDGKHRQYFTAHVVQFTDGKISSWTEMPGSLHEFEEAWGTR